jgi:hypothetical protein
MRKAKDRQPIIDYCNKPRTSRDIMATFVMSGGVAHCIMNQLIDQKLIVRGKKSVGKSSKLMYVIPSNQHLLHQSEDITVGNLLELLPAHDPFGWCKGVSHAR